MIRACLCMLIVICCQSCNYFETQKMDADTFYKDEMATINWDDVDRYPLFSNCDETASKAEQLSCFHSQISASLDPVLSDSIHGVLVAVNDTVHLELHIDTLGVFHLKQLEMDSLTRTQLPNLDKWLASALDDIGPVSPAIKRGVPVATRYTLPVVLLTD